MNNLDIATGKTPTASGEGGDVYATTGQMDTWAVKDQPPPAPAPTCYILSLGTTCTNGQIRAVLNGTAVIKNWVVVDGSKGSSGTGSGGSGTTPKKNDGAAMDRLGRVGVVLLVLATGSLIAFGV
jgi:hypothetical protein